VKKNYINKPSKIKGIICAIVSFIFCLVLIPTVAAIGIGMLGARFGGENIPLIAIMNIVALLLAIPLAIWSAWKSYRTYNPPQDKRAV